MQTESADKNKSTLCAIYTRVSTDMQAEVEFNSCEAQEERIPLFHRQPGGFKIFKVYTRRGRFPGANTHRRDGGRAPGTSAPGTLTWS
ncbi:MAG: recombinase family protein [Elusimicrobia bacterium]|nr:recombinase family protein [Elusimicrobiota bacterium]